MTSYIKYLLFISIIAFKPGKINAQNELGLPDPNDHNLSGILYHVSPIYKASTFLYGDYTIGSIYMENGEIFTNVPVKYNRYTDELIFIHKKYFSPYVVDKLTLKAFTINSLQPDSLYFIKYRGVDKDYELKNGDFLNLLFKGNLKLYAKRTTILERATEVGGQDALLPINIYYVQNNDWIKEIKPNKRSVFKIFPEQKKEIKKLMRKYHFEKRNENSLIKLIKGIDQL